MLKKDLRIGNYVMYHGDITEIYYLSENAHTEIASCVEYRDLQPIPLTEEWLLRFGFKKLVNDWQIKGLIIHTRKRGFVVNKRIPIIKYVHQLQNLYYALTQTELTLKDEK